MFASKTYPSIFQHGPVSSTMKLKGVPDGSFAGRSVAIVRTLRDGSITREYLPEYLAELVVAMIPYAEPMVASAHIAYSEL